MENLKKIRLKRGLSQNALCEELEKLNCHISRSAYSKYENGSRTMSYKTLIKIADYFNTSTDYLLGHTDCETRH